jgi:lysozyme family protein
MMAESQKIGSPEFQAADAFTAAREGGLNEDDLGSVANYGINQAAHPEVDVRTLTPQSAQRIRYQYWTAVGGDKIAQQSPALASAVYDTAIMAGPQKAKQLLEKSGGDPANFMQLRADYLGGLAGANPDKYGKVAESWKQRDESLSSHIGVTAPQRGQSKETGAVAAQTTAEAPVADTGSIAQELTHAAQSGIAAQQKPAAASPLQQQPQHALGAKQSSPLVGRSTRQVYEDILKSKNKIA